MKSIKKTNNQIRIITSGLLLSSAAGIYAEEKVSVENNTPNVIYFLCDDLGISDLEVYGNQIISTPNITKLAQNGMTFTQHYSGSTVSAPSRASLLTGQHTGHTKIRGNREISPEGQEPLDPSVLNIAQLFKSVGYNTGVFGKWGLGYPGSVAEPTKVGFDTFYGYNCQREAHTYYPKWLYNNSTKVNLDGKTYSQDLIHQRAMQFIRDNKDTPFFGYFAYVLPHASLEQPNDSIVAQYIGKFNETRYNGGGYAATDRPRTQFAGMVSRIDAYVGQIMDELEELGILDNTIFIFTSDNGPHIEGGADPVFFNTEKLFKGLKRALYEGGIRVPMIASWENHIPAGTTTNHVSAFWDIMPTFTELLNQKENWQQETDGISFLPTLLGEGEQKEHDYLYWEFHEENGRQLVRKGSWTLLRQNVKTANPTLELYNIDDDLYQDTNLADKYPEKLNELLEIMNNARTESSLFKF